MRYSLALGSVCALLGAVTGRADDVLPARSNFDRYLAMVDRSPFAVATAVALPSAEADFAKDLYVANAAHSPEVDMVTIASISDQSFKEYLTTRAPVHGYNIASIEWSDRVGATKVTISKDGKFATLSFNQALLSQRGSPNVPPAPAQMPQKMLPPQSKPPMPSSAAVQAPSAGLPPAVQRKLSTARVDPQEPQRQANERSELRRRQKARSPRQ